MKNYNGFDYFVTSNSYDIYDNKASDISNKMIIASGFVKNPEQRAKEVIDTICRIQQNDEGKIC